MSNFVVGLTGGIGSGKTTVANMFIDLGIDVIDADIVAREVVQPNSFALNAIAEKFGKHFIDDHGQLNRSKLRSQIFSNINDKNWLNKLLHPLIRQTITKQLQQATSSYCILVAPLLIENNLHHIVNTVLVINTEPSIQLARTVKRDKSTEVEIKAIIASQIDQKQRLAAANDVINNNNDKLDNIKKNVVRLHQRYLTQADELKHND